MGKNSFFILKYLLRFSIGNALKDHKLCQLSDGEKGFRDHNSLNKYKKSFTTY